MLKSRWRILILISLFCCSVMQAQDLTVAIGFGFGSANESIEFASSRQQSFFYPKRQIQYINAFEVSIRKSINSHVDLGGEISRSTGYLDPNYIVTSSTIISLNQINWISFGAFANVRPFTQGKLKMLIVPSMGIHAGYPLGVFGRSIERKTAIVAGLHFGLEYHLSKKIYLSYIIGKGKYNNEVGISYLVAPKKV